MPAELTLDIFFANDLVKPVHVGSADNIETARAQMERVATEKPGWYFVWDADRFRVIARLDTTQPSSR